MISRALIGKAVFALLLIGTIVLAALGYRAFQGNLNALNASSQEPIDWSAMQLEIELLKFDSELARFAMAETTATPNTVNHRFDILWSRVAVFQRGKVGERLAAYSGTSDTIAQLFDAMKLHEDTIVGLKADDHEATHQLLREFTGFVNDIRLMSRTVYLGEIGAEAQMRSDLRESAYLTAYASIAFLLLSIIALVYINRESLRFQNLARRNRQLAYEAEEANKSKSRFLTMMSHELRTPMNGVLGTLALVRQSGLPAPQQRLLDRAESSGKQMTTMLSDILDFSALQDDQLTLENKMFETGDLVAAIEELFGAVAQREGIEFSISSDASCPFRMRGDFKRIRQSLSHLTAYIVETAGTKNVRILLSHSDDMLRATIDFEYSSQGGAWQPDLIVGNVERTSDQFASDALGPSVARALIERMGGSIKVDSPDDERISIIASVRAEAVEIKQLHIRLEIASSALRAVCMAALAQDNVSFLDEGDARNAHIVLTDCGGSCDATTSEELNAKYPGAMLVAVGEPVQPDLFDGYIRMPIDIADLRESVISRMVG